MCIELLIALLVPWPVAGSLAKATHIRTDPGFTVDSHSQTVTTKRCERLDPPRAELSFVLYKHVTGADWRTLSPDSSNKYLTSPNHGQDLIPCTQIFLYKIGDLVFTRAKVVLIHFPGDILKFVFYVCKYLMLAKNFQLNGVETLLKR